MISSGLMLITTDLLLLLLPLLLLLLLMLLPLLLLLAAGARPRSRRLCRRPEPRPFWRAEEPQQRRLRQ